MKLEFVGTTSRGYEIYREPNEAGGHRYLTDSIGGGAVNVKLSIKEMEAECGIPSTTLRRWFGHVPRPVFGDPEMEQRLNKARKRK